MELFDTLGDGNVILLIGLTTGFGFGVCGQQSRFCLRAATLEFWRAMPGQKLVIWLLAFSAALLLTQWQLLYGSLDAQGIRQLSGTGSLSGAIIGGVLFGVGMIMARGCASRLLILSATGNLRALTTGLILTVIAQSSLRGVLSPWRETLSSWWTISGPSRALANYMPTGTALILSAMLLVVALGFGRHLSLGIRVMLCSMGVGAAVALGWWATNWHAGWSFEASTIQSVTFTGPSADTLMALINQPELPRTFGIGLVPGVFLGALLASLASREFAVQGFDRDTGMLRYLAGAALMGFGSMLAGGCAVGAGVTGGAVLATTAWVALFSMWIGAGLGIWWFEHETPPEPSDAFASASPAGYQPAR